MPHRLKIIDHPPTHTHIQNGFLLHLRGANTWVEVKATFGKHWSQVKVSIRISTVCGGLESSTTRGHKNRKLLDRRPMYRRTTGSMRFYMELLYVRGYFKLNKPSSWTEDTTRKGCVSAQALSRDLSVTFSSEPVTSDQAVISNS